MLAKIGEGATGVVYKAQDLALGRGVAIKCLPPERSADESAMLRFKHEARMASSLNHANICTVYDIADHDGIQFIVMELLEGTTLSLVIAGEPLPMDDLLQFGVQICDALDAAHAENIIHRDLKPANVFVTTRGQVKILDFGLAQFNPARATLEQQAVKVWGPNSAGTVPYMSPEQLNNSKIDARADLFAVGIILYEMATGRRAFAGKTIAEIQHAILHDAPAPPRAINPNLPADLERIIVKALEKNRELRYQSASDIRADLQRLKRDLDTVRSTPKLPMKESRHSSRWELARYGMGIAIAAGLIAVGAAAFRQNSIRPVENPTVVSAPPPQVVPRPVTPPPQVTASPPESVKAPAAVVPPPAPTTTRSAAQDLRIARGMLQAGLQDQASAKLAELVKTYPATKEALEGYFLIAHIQQTLGRTNDALATYLEIAERFKGNVRVPEALFQMALLTRQSDREQRDLEARRILSSLVTDYPRSRWAPRTLLTKAELEDALRLTESDPMLGPSVPASLVTYRRLVTDYPKSTFHPVAMVRLARGYEKLKKYNLAAQAFADFATMHPKGADEAWYKSAEIYRRYVKDIEKARAAYTNVSAESRYYPQAQRQLKSISSRKQAPSV